jgi:predicted transposase YbfD/YdcC
MTGTFLDLCCGLEEYRVPGMVTYPLAEIVFAAFIGVMCSGDDWEDIALIAAEKVDFLRRYLPYADGVAPEQTMRRCFAYLDSADFQERFTQWVMGITGRLRGVIAIDGKTLRRTKDTPKNKKALHLVSAFAHEAGLVIAQHATDEKSNEITAIPTLLEKLCIEGCIVTIDAMGTQTAIAEKITERKADYVLALKGNQGTLAHDVGLFFADPALAPTCATTTTTDIGHGRIETRICRVTDNIDWLTDLRSIAAITATRIIKTTGETSAETRFYISSLPANAVVMLDATRSHWSVENNLHWIMDVTFHDDLSRAREKNLALNFSVLKHAAFNMLKRITAKLSIKSKRKKAALNNAFLTASLENHSVKDS